METSPLSLQNNALFLHITKSSIPFKRKVSKARLSSFNVKENVNGPMNFTTIMNTILFNLCVNRNT